MLIDLSDCWRNRWREELGRPNQAKTRSIIALLCEWGVSIVELVAVIPILWILAAVAGRNPSTLRTLLVVRNAVNRYAAAAAFPKQ